LEKPFSTLKQNYFAMVPIGTKPDGKEIIYFLDAQTRPIRLGQVFINKIELDLGILRDSMSSCLNGKDRIGSTGIDRDIQKGNQE
jgi:hypothetical protein